MTFPSGSLEQLASRSRKEAAIRDMDTAWQLAEAGPSAEGGHRLPLDALEDAAVVLRRETKVAIVSVETKRQLEPLGTFYDPSSPTGQGDGSSG